MWRREGSHLGRIVRAAAGALLAASVLAMAASPADARHRHVRHYAHFAHASHVTHVARRSFAGVRSSPAFSAIVVDANSGRTLYAVDPDGLRHPASITKVMTLYLLFERLETGAMTLQTRIPISERAAAQEPSKLGLEPGSTISVEDAIKAVVTRSANDVAVAIAEAIGHDESTFAVMMTRKAHALGMAHTNYADASGLPNDEQITTARDLTILARSLEDRFPRYFRYFSTEEFEYDGQTIGNHNHLLGRVDGVDGIKTGYTRASGFNLLTSVHKDGRSLIAVVMGGRTAAARDRVMENLIDDHLAQCSTVRTATRIADASAAEAEAAQRPAQPSRPRPIAVAAGVPTHLPAARAQETDEGEGDDADNDEPTLRVSAVRTVAAPHPAQAAPFPPRPVAERLVAASDAADAEPAPRKASPAELGWRKGPDAAPTAQKAASTPPAKPKLVSSGKASESSVEVHSIDDSNVDAPQGGKWKIQIGATDDAAKATALLDKARKHDRNLLAAAKPMTEKVRKGENAFYRAQFAGLDSASAESACRSLKRSGFSCFATRD
jgi:D-alanyl-D-alanine carboxypeptidase